MGPIGRAMSLTVHLLGRPRLERAHVDAYRFRSRKSWALLAYLLLTDRQPSRAHLASLLFADADDPGRALRWSLAEIRRGLEGNGSVGDDPVVVRLGGDVVVDVRVLAHGAAVEAADLPGLGSDLLEGMSLAGAAAFDTWLLAQQRRVAAASEAILHEAALRAMSRGLLEVALGHALRLASMNPLDENHQALLIRLYRRLGDEEGAARQFAACTDTFARELGVAPGRGVVAAMREPLAGGSSVVDAVTVEAMLESGTAAVAAGARDAGVESLRQAARLADAVGTPRLRVTSRMLLAEALIHSIGGLDDAGAAMLHEADEIALDHGLTDLVAQAQAELGYVDFVGARYERAERWFRRALTLAGPEGSAAAKALAYLGAVESDRGNYAEASGLLERALVQSRLAGEPRREAFVLSMLGRIAMFRADFDDAAGLLDAAIALAERDRWLAFLPWPQAFRGEVELAGGGTAAAQRIIEQAFARACQLGDPCWEATGARALALAAEARGETGRAFELLADARRRNHRYADPYVWLDGYILDAQATLGRRHGHTEAPVWVETMRELAARTGMRELAVRSLLHGAALGNERDREAVAVLATDVESPPLRLLLPATG
jgi:DNA-binding SARP family transcriptional activator